MNQVLGIRDNEIKVLKKSAWLMSLVAFIWTSVPFLVALASFATYVFIDEGNVLTAEKAFVTLSYLVSLLTQSYEHLLSVDSRKFWS